MAWGAYTRSRDITTVGWIPHGFGQHSGLGSCGVTAAKLRFPCIGAVQAMCSCPPRTQKLRLSMTHVRKGRLNNMLVLYFTSSVLVAIRSMWLWWCVVCLVSFIFGCSTRFMSPVYGVRFACFEGGVCSLRYQNVSLLEMFGPVACVVRVPCCTHALRSPIWS